ncbi:MAG: carbon-nitrogen hydrolase family protein [Chlorobi bacterium]|nr:carbon-nitrogen hydrolase family protein [Chlorobiota bacterium]
MIKIALIQQHATDSRAENTERAIKAFEEAAAKRAQLICFAELAFEPFYPQYRASGDVTRLAETIPGPTTDAFAKLAKKYGIVVVLNLFEKENNRTYDASPVIDADGRLLGKTRMVHIPDYQYFHEKTYYAPGDTGAPVYDTAVGRIGVAICYDRHYPEYMRALGLAGAELVITPQAGAEGEWTEGLYEAEMQIAAFQNGYFTALCNRVGREDNLMFSGESFVCDPDGRVVAQAGTGTDEILYCDIDPEKVKTSHAKRLFFPDRREELYGEWF